MTELAAYVEQRVPELTAELAGRFPKEMDVSNAKGEKQSAHFGSTGEDFALVARLP